MNVAVGVVCAWLGLVFWGTSSSTRGRVWWAVAGFVLSQTVYVPVISATIADVVGSQQACNQFMNMWGLVSALVVIACLVFRHRAALVATALVGAVSVVALAVLAEVERPSPVGCVATIDVPPWSPYWWLLVVVHVVSSLFAFVVCAVDARRSGAADPALTAGLSSLAVAFLSSVLFWLAMGVTLVLDARDVGTAASTYLFPVTVLATAVAVWIPVIDRGVRLAGYRRRIQRLWREWLEVQRSVHPDRALPSRREVVGAWWHHPDLVVHQLEVQIADGRLSIDRDAVLDAAE